MTLYLDHAATSPVRREVLEAMWPYLSTEFGNPSSHHSVGESASRALLWAREQIASVFECRPAEVIFTGGGTESNNLAIKGISLANPRGRHLVVSAIEHPSVLESCAYLARLHGFEVTEIGVDRDGLVHADDVAEALRPDTTLVSVMYAHNEVGTVQPVALIADAARRQGAAFHTDAVQAAGWLGLGRGELPASAVTIAGHKLGAPKGVGALILRAGTPIEPLLHGGGQERGRRSGTENVAGAVGLATALTLAEADRAVAGARLSVVRDQFIEAVLATVPGARLTGHSVLRLPTSASFCFEGTSGEAVLLELEQLGVIVSSGSACAAGSSDPSTVLTAMGITPDVAHTAVRFTLGHESDAGQMAEVASAVRTAVVRVQEIGVSRPN
ncbi:cysteine desulfurase family protein [Homoserinimonas hongtaonis]|uniref:Cysteine desulfurase n=1 Tax=Homoserinimonas hongtaonis TaxID=2079791 RepID=A0A2U1SYY5_9MICO|nr:cysteine desulfurase family protein [Salinibacterium hongtaonis]PWB96840.1 cysteine desulfurase [Salinibacterium hongtaonis]